MKNKVVNVISISLSAISLIADLIGISAISFQLITTGHVGDLVWKVITIVIVFLFGVGIGYLRFLNIDKEPLERVLKIYVWAYMIVACITYFGISLQFRSEYSLEEYFSFLLIMVIQLGAFTALRVVSRIEDAISYSLAIFTIAVIHAIMFLFDFIFDGMPPFLTALSEWLFWGLWTAYSVHLLRSSFSPSKKHSFIP